MAKPHQLRCTIRNPRPNNSDADVLHGNPGPLGTIHYREPRLDSRLRVRTHTFDFYLLKKKKAAVVSKYRHGIYYNVHEANISSKIVYWILLTRTG